MTHARPTTGEMTLTTQRTMGNRRLAACVLVAVAATLAAVVALVGPRPAAAAPNGYAVGISDNKPSTFLDSRFHEIGIKTARLVIPWNAIRRDPAGVKLWMDGARAGNIQPLVAFDRARGNRCPQAPCYVPTIAEYRQAFRMFMTAYPWVRYVTPWNEANHPSQPTVKTPERVADFHDAIADVCRRCTVVAGDALDSFGVERWIARYERQLRRKHGRTVRIWGIHNYVSANYFLTAPTIGILRATKADIWLTETGGIVQMLTFDTTRLNYDEQRAARALRSIFDLTSRFPCRIKRTYIYNWQAVAGERFDTGVIAPDGTTRPTFDILRTATQPTAPVQNGPARCAAVRARTR